MKFILILYCSNNKDIINYSVENCSSLAFIASEYLVYDDCNISSNNSLLCFLKTEEKLFHFSVSRFRIVLL
jgi:hypothetical protein